MATPGRPGGETKGNAPRGQEGLNGSFAAAFRKETEDWVNPRRRAKGEPEVDAGKIAASNELMGIAFSGGGMRSATFCLGVAQALARRGSLEPDGLLAKADYMATVSGGGYFGTSLTSLCAEPLPYESPNLERFGVSASSFPYGFPGPQHSGGEEGEVAPVHGLESPALRHVRENANMIAPTFGLFDGETWAGAARYLFSLLATWLFFLLPLPTGVFLATMFIPESWWCRFDPLFSAGCGPTWLSDHWLALAAPLAPVGVILLLGFVLFVVASVQQTTSGRDYRDHETARKVITKLIEVLLVSAGVLAVCVIMVLGMWGVHWLVVLKGTGFLGEIVLAALGFGGMGVAGASARKLTVPEWAKKTTLTAANRVLPKIGLAVGGYVLLLVVALVWYYFLWTAVFPSAGSLQGASADTVIRWRWFIAVAALSLVCAGWATGWGTALLNRLSLNNLYEERILRTWVIAAKPPKRKGQAVAQGIWRKVWERPDLTMGSLRRKNGIGPGESAPSSPLHLVVTALNTTGSKLLPRRDRRAESYVISPTTYGSNATGWGTTTEVTETELGNMRLSQAAAISGAAASPNMGMKTHPTLSVVTTLLNIRLGAWVANPDWGKRWEQRASLPWWKELALWKELIGERFPGCYWQEMMGKAYDAGPHVYLSDGGHFENLGIYELLRRRCKFIIAVDATGEPQGDKAVNFGGIGIPLRLARIDFGVEVDIDLRLLERSKETGYAGSYFAVGRIRYPRMARDNRHGKASDLTDQDTGFLVLIKSGVVEGALSPDIINYMRQVNPRFPYDSTLDQQFEQPQFESYRQLGYIAGRAVTDAAASLKEPLKKSPIVG